MRRILFNCLAIICGLSHAPLLLADDALPHAKPVPRMQATPLPRYEVAVTDDGRELTRYIFDPREKRTFLYPLNGPAGRSLTRMGHPRDPNSHSHHNSVWISHNNIGGVDFWSDTGKGQIVQRRVVRYEDTNAEAMIQVELDWKDDANRVLMKELRTMRVRPLENREWILLLDLELASPDKEPVIIGETAFGFLGVRMTKTIGVHDGGGVIRNSAGAVNEKEVFRKPAKWVDYSGPITREANEGILLMDHPQNYSHPTPFHVREDGWMGIATTFAGARTIEPGSPLQLRYGLYIHAGVPKADQLEAQFAAFAKTEAPPARIKK